MKALPKNCDLIIKRALSFLDNFDVLKRFGLKLINNVKRFTMLTSSL